MIGTGFLAIGLFDGSPIITLLSWAFILFLFLYAQELQVRLMLRGIKKSLIKLDSMKDRSRRETVDYFVKVGKSSQNPTERIQDFLEYFTIMPVDMDPGGLIGKIDYLVNTNDQRIRDEIKHLLPSADPVTTTSAQNLLEVAAGLNMLHKIIRHFYILGNRTKSPFVVVQLQMVMPMLMQEADAYINAIDAFKLSQPIGDGIGPMVVGRMMLGQKTKEVGKDTILANKDVNGRHLLFLKAEGPMATVGQPGHAMENIVNGMKTKVSTIVMIDAALKLEGENTGEIAEGIGAAIGGIGVERFQIEEVATKNRIPLYAVVVKQSLTEAISSMKREIAETAENVSKIVHNIVSEKTRKGDTVLIVGVGNTLGVAQ
ncbi:MAG: DUF1512 family protein [Nitrososphaerales archaeon]